MPKRLFKYKLLLDENMPNRKYLVTLNKRFDVKHISSDFKKDSLSDPQVYKFARDNKRLIITHNVKDFEKLAILSMDTGVIGVSANLTNNQIDKKLTALLMKSKKSELLGKCTYISGETEN